MKRHSFSGAYFLILTGCFLLFLSGMLFLYWWVNKPPILEYAFSTTEINLKPLEDEKDWEITIPKIEITAPIIMNIDGNNEEEYLRSLQRGVAQLRGTKIPGQKGNVFIFGHSSYLFYDPGEYKTIFRKLDDLDNGDEIVVKSNLGEYKYKVFDKKIINPDEVQVTQDVIKGEETLSLMTCNPPGTTFRRLVVVAKRE